MSLTVCVGVRGSKRRACTLLGTEWPPHTQGHAGAAGANVAGGRVPACVSPDCRQGGVAMRMDPVPRL